MGLFYGHNKSISEGLGYGYLYNWHTVNGNTANLITDLHVPNDTELGTLDTYLGGSSLAGGKLKEVGLIHWLTPNTSAADTYNFTMLGSGFRSNVGVFSDLRRSGNIWSSTVIDSSNSSSYSCYYNFAVTTLFSAPNKYGFSVRCLRTLTAQEQIDYSDGEVIEVKSDYDGNNYDVVRIGTQGWSVGNLKTTHYLDGTPLTKVTDGTAWSNLTTEGYCAYNNDEGNV